MDRPPAMTATRLVRVRFTADVARHDKKRNEPVRIFVGEAVEEPMAQSSFLHYARLAVREIPILVSIRE